MAWARAGRMQGHFGMLLCLSAAWAAAAAGAQVPAACPPASEVPRLAPRSAVAGAGRLLSGCVVRDLEAGRWLAARQRLEQAQRGAIVLDGAERQAWDARIARLDASRRIDTGQWAALADEVVASEHALPWVGPLVRGVAAARAAWAAQDPVLLARARDRLADLEALALRAGPVSDEERARLLVQGAIAGSQYEREEMQLLLAAAHDLEVRLASDDESRAPVVSARELEADLLLVTDRYQAASERYRELLQDSPRRVQARIGLADAYRRLGHAKEADETLAQARALWADADPDVRARLR